MIGWFDLPTKKWMLLVGLVRAMFPMILSQMVIVVEEDVRAQV